MSTASAPDEQSDVDRQNSVEVTLLGGPPDWHNATMRVPQSDLVDVDFAGAMLISDHTPHRGDDEDPDPRAVYDPDPEPAPATLWWFRGWFPAAVGRPEWRRPSPADREPVVEVDVDAHGCPAAWTLPSGERWSADRLQVHWLFDGEGAAGDDMGVWQLRAHTDREPIAGWELIHDPAVGWAAGRIPQVQEQQ